MTEGVNKFDTFRQEQARLRDPLLVSGAVELVPMDWDEVMPTLVQSKKKKRKSRSGPAPSASVDAIGAAHLPEDERLLPASFIFQAKAKAMDSETPTAGRAAGKTLLSGQRLRIAQQKIAKCLDLFQGEPFEVVAPGAQHVELIWSRITELGSGERPSAPPATGRETAKTEPDPRGRVFMDHQQHDRFICQIGIADGDYRSAYAVDGHLRPDPRFAQRVLVNRGGIFALHRLARHEEIITLFNEGAAPVKVQFEASVDWLVPSHGEIELPAGETLDSTVRIDLARMQVGPNIGLLFVSSRAEHDSNVAGVVRFAIEVTAGGAVPQFSYGPSDLGEINQGVADPKLDIAVAAIGRGALTGMVNLPHSGQLADFRLDPDGDKDNQFHHTFEIESANLMQPHLLSAEAMLKVVLITDSYLANYRLIRAEIPYRLVYLKKSLPALSFGIMRPGSTKSLRLDVIRNDKQAIDLAVVLPNTAEAYLEAYPARAGAYVFRLDTSTLSPGCTISEIIELTDRNSGLRDQIKVFATVANDSGANARAGLTNAAQAVELQAEAEIIHDPTSREK